ncbi:MAG: T9SS type A sorting domain-containing protein [Saprospiraceae bacterium]
MTDSLFNYGHLTACIHADGDKWWTNMVGFNSNEFHYFLIGGQDTVQGPFVQEIGEPMIDDEVGIVQAAYSPDATMLAYASQTDNKVLLYSFNNETGELSNPQVISDIASGDAVFWGLAFSFDSRFIYTNTQNDLYQIDLTDNSIEHIAHHESFDEDNWPVGMGNMTLGPDCRIYISPGSTTYYLHVIHRPNEKGAACGFEARALRSPGLLAIDVPNLPMYRFGGACDSTIHFPYKDTVSLAVGAVAGARVATLFPNPVRDYFTVAFEGQAPPHATLHLYDGLGRPCFEGKLPASNNVIEVGGLPPGLYFYVLKSGGERVQEGRLVKVE